MFVFRYTTPSSTPAEDLHIPRTLTRYAHRDVDQYADKHANSNQYPHGHPDANGHPDGDLYQHAHQYAHRY